MPIAKIAIVIGAIAVAFAIAYFQYLFKSPKTRLHIGLAALRLIGVLAGVLLLINPEFTKKSYFIEKAKLIIAIDNSASIEAVGGSEAAKEVQQKFAEADNLSDRFDLDFYQFGAQVSPLDSLQFSSKITNIAASISSLKDIYLNGNNALVVVSDGNQTLGEDYEYVKLGNFLQANAIVVGDTTQYNDVRIAQVNANKYAFLKNKFPVETTVVYDGRSSISTTFKIIMNGRVVFSKPVKLNESKNSETINALIEAGSIGVKTLQVVIEPISNEKNSSNNRKDIAIEVIDEKSKITVISSIMHPDMGMLKKAIEANEQREVSFVKPNVPLDELEDTDIFILYQPNRSFEGVYNFIKKRGGGLFTITGSKTDWNYLNQIQSSFTKENYNQFEEILPTLNEGFSTFDIGDIKFVNFPPLKESIGDIRLNKSFEPIIYQRIKGVVLESPLLALIEDKEQKEMVLFGEHLWKWRVQHYKEQRSFEGFDNFIGKMMLYLSDNTQKKRLQVDYSPIYEGNINAYLNATYFDASFVFDPNASLNLSIKSTDGSISREIPMLLKGNRFKVDLSNLPPNTFNFTVSVANTNISSSGSFRILDFDLEKQLVSSNNDKLKRFAVNNNGDLYYPNQVDNLLTNLTSDNRLKPIQKSKETSIGLIDFWWMLALMIVALAAEWFIRKYNGLL